MSKIQIMAAMIAATIAVPATSSADHRRDPSRLLPAAETLHQTILAFEQIACSRPLPKHEQHYIRLMTAKACRLVDGISCGASWSRVEVDHHVLRAFIRTVDLRLNYNCAFRHDHVFQRSWRCVLHEFDAFSCLLAPAPAPHICRGYPCHCCPPPVGIHPRNPFGRGLEEPPLNAPRFDEPPLNEPALDGRFGPEPLDIPSPEGVQFRRQRTLEGGQNPYRTPVRQVRSNRSDVSPLLRLLMAALQD